MLFCVCGVLVWLLSISLFVFFSLIVLALKVVICLALVEGTLLKQYTMRA